MFVGSIASAGVLDNDAGMLVDFFDDFTHEGAWTEPEDSATFDMKAGGTVVGTWDQGNHSSWGD